MVRAVGGLGFFLLPSPLSFCKKELLSLSPGLPQDHLSTLSGCYEWYCAHPLSSQAQEMGEDNFWECFWGSLPNLRASRGAWEADSPVCIQPTPYSHSLPWPFSKAKSLSGDLEKKTKPKRHLFTHLSSSRPGSVWHWGLRDDPGPASRNP